MRHKGDHGYPRLYNRSVRFSFKKRVISVEYKMRKISRKRFIGLAMYLGFPVRLARIAADAVIEHGVSYTEGYLLLEKVVMKRVQSLTSCSENTQKRRFSCEQGQAGADAGGTEHAE